MANHRARKPMPGAGRLTWLHAGKTCSQVGRREAVAGCRCVDDIGYRLGSVAAPALWVKEVPAWAKAAPRVKARATKAGAIELADPKGSESTLFVILTPR